MGSADFYVPLRRELDEDELGEDESALLGREQRIRKVCSIWERMEHVCRSREGCRRKENCEVERRRMRKSKNQQGKVLQGGWAHEHQLGRASPWKGGMPVFLRVKCEQKTENDSSVRFCRTQKLSSSLLAILF